MSWRISLKVSGKIRLDSIRDAYEKYPHPQGEEIHLMTDGGCENRNDFIENYLNEPAVSIKQIIAQKDVHFSNSIVESVNKTIKYSWLYRKDIPDFNSLERYLDEVIVEYNEKRTHYAFKYLTPKEVFEGTEVDENELKEKMKIARAKRIKDNQGAGCGVCDE